jgi:hypothetical protein
MPVQDVLAGVSWPPRPVRVVALDHDAGTVAGHRLWIRSVEDWGAWMDVRVARVDEDGTRPLPRRLPPPDAWTAWLDGAPLEVADMVGRGDRRFSDGELRLRPGLPADGGGTLLVRVVVHPDEAPLTIELTLP